MKPPPRKFAFELARILRAHAVDLVVSLGDAALAAKLVERFTAWRGAALDSKEALALAQNAAGALGHLAPPRAAEVLLDALARRLDKGSR